ncbi:MAG: hypothetical protein JST42_04460 [Bacteroidetes bacterium]|nr:hypothetical protein [Bacteroidota bacterium]
MKKLLVLLVVQVILIAFSANAQSFEGEIVYTNNYVSKVQGVSGDRMAAMLGKKQEYFIKGGYYKSVLNGSMVAWQVYDYNQNRLFTRMPAQDTVMSQDASENADSVISYEIKKDAATILGNRCDELVLKTRAGSETFFYNPKYKLDVASFSRHLYGNWAFYAAKTGAVPLKMVIETPQFTMESEASEIKPMRLENSFFMVDGRPNMK